VTEVVYMIGTPGSNTVKIGRTTNLQKRFGEIQRMSPVPLAVLWQHPGGHELETRLHRHFADLRSHGEWFTFRVDPVQHVQWAVDGKPWLRPKVSLKKAPPAPPRIPAPRPVPLSLDGPEDPNIGRLRVALIQSINDIPDLVERHNAVNEMGVEIKQKLRDIKQQAVLNLKQGRSWREVGDILGVTGARAEQISRGAR
jgi:hypothetical protein